MSSFTVQDQNEKKMKIYRHKELKPKRDGHVFFLPVSSLNQVGDSMTGYNGWRLLSQGSQKKTKNQTFC